MPSHQGYQKVAQDTIVPDNKQPNRMDKSITSDGGNLPSTHSSQQLMPTDTESVNTSLEGNRTSNNDVSQNLRSVNIRAWFSIGVLCFVNLINYMDRFTVASKFMFSFYFIYVTSFSILSRIVLFRYFFCNYCLR